MSETISCPITARIDGQDAEFFTIQAIPTCRGIAKAVMSHYRNVYGREVFVNWMNVIPLKPKWVVRVE